MSDFIGIKKHCLLCKHSSTKDKNITCNNKKSSFYGLRVNEVLCAPCMDIKEIDKGTNVETVSFG